MMDQETKKEMNLLTKGMNSLAKEQIKLLKMIKNHEMRIRHLQTELSKAKRK